MQSGVPDPERLDTALWRATLVARVASLAYAVGSAVFAADAWVRPWLAVVVLAAMAVWTVVVSLLLPRARSDRRTAVLVLDLAVGVLALLAGVAVQGREAIEAGTPSLTVTWGAVPVIAWAVHRGAAGGTAAAAVVCAATVLWRGALDRPTVGSCVLLLLLGSVVGYVVQLGRRAERTLARAVQVEAAASERERLARQVHDGVLQALALLGRESTDARLAALASSQERALRRLLLQPADSGADSGVDSGLLDLRALLPRGDDVELVTPADPVPLPARAARELAAAVAACVDNVRRHAGVRAFVLVEQEQDAVLVTVRDDGPGMAPGRPEEAAAQGRLGLTRSVRGRVADLGGTVAIVSAPGEGTEVELRVPRAPGA